METLYSINEVFMRFTLYSKVVFSLLKALPTATITPVLQEDVIEIPDSPPPSTRDVPTSDSPSKRDEPKVPLLVDPTQPGPSQPRATTSTQPSGQCIFRTNLKVGTLIDLTDDDESSRSANANPEASQQPCPSRRRQPQELMGGRSGMSGIPPIPPMPIFDNRGHQYPPVHQLEYMQQMTGRRAVSASEYRTLFCDPPYQFPYPSHGTVWRGPNNQQGRSSHDRPQPPPVFSQWTPQQIVPSLPSQNVPPPPSPPPPPSVQEIASSPPPQISSPLSDVVINVEVRDPGEDTRSGEFHNLDIRKYCFFFDRQ